MDKNRINLDPKIWGPYGWLFIQSCILSYPENPNNNDKEGFRQLLGSLKIVLPCLKCRNHFEEYIYDNPLDNNILNNKENLIKWILGAQNNVNKINNKELITYDEFINYYKNHYSINNLNEESCSVSCNKKCIKNNKENLYDIKDMIYMITFIVIILIVLICYKKYQN
jgi:hypothetical protein